MEKRFLTIPTLSTPIFTINSVFSINNDNISSFLSLLYSQYMQKYNLFYIFPNLLPRIIGIYNTFLIPNFVDFQNYINNNNDSLHTQIRITTI